MIKILLKSQLIFVFLASQSYRQVRFQNHLLCIHRCNINFSCYLNSQKNSTQLRAKINKLVKTFILITVSFIFQMIVKKNSY